MTLQLWGLPAALGVLPVAVSLQSLPPASCGLSLHLSLLVRTPVWSGPRPLPQRDHTLTQAQLQ